MTSGVSRIFRLEGSWSFPPSFRRRRSRSIAPTIPARCRRNRNYNLPPLRTEANQRLMERSAGRCSPIREQTDLRVDSPGRASTSPPDTDQFPVAPGSRELFLVPEPLRLPEFLHSDHQAESRKSNLSSIPFDVLARRMPEIFREGRRGTGLPVHAARPSRAGVS